VLIFCGRIQRCPCLRQWRQHTIILRMRSRVWRSAMICSISDLVGSIPYATTARIGLNGTTPQPSAKVVPSRAPPLLPWLDAALIVISCEAQGINKGGAADDIGAISARPARTAASFSHCGSCQAGVASRSEWPRLGARDCLRDRSLTGSMLTAIQPVESGRPPCRLTAMLHGEGGSVAAVRRIVGCSAPWAQGVKMWRHERLVQAHQ